MRKPLKMAAVAAGLAIALAAGLVGGLVGASAPASAQEVTLRLHQFLPLRSTIPAKAITPWIEAVEADSGGRIEIEHYPSMQLGGAPSSLYDQARDGVVDIVWTLLGYTPGRFHKLEAFELPFMVSTAEATSMAFHEFVQRHGLDELSDVHPLVVHTHGPGLLHVRGEGVRSLDDMAGLTLRGPTRVITKMLDDMGASAVGMPVPAVPEALSKGVIDGAVVPWEVTVPLKIAELVDSHTGFEGDRGLYTATFALVMNKDSYAALPDDLKEVIDAHGGIETAALFGAAMDEGDEAGQGIARSRGNEIRMLDPGPWEQAAQATIDDWIAEMDARGHDGAALVAEARALIEKYSAE